MTSARGQVLYKAAGTGKGTEIFVNCRLFADFVPLEVCSRRKRELDTFCWNSCSGCSFGAVSGRTGTGQER